MNLKVLNLNLNHVTVLHILKNGNDTKSLKYVYVGTRFFA